MFGGGEEGEGGLSQAFEKKEKNRSQHERCEHWLTPLEKERDDMSTRRVL